VTSPLHVPVLLDEVLRYLAPRSGARYVDATVDGGGHCAAVLEGSAPDGHVLGIDRDPEIITALRVSRCAEVGSGRFDLAIGNFRELSRILAARRFLPIDGILFDLGLSSFHLDVSGRGFSFSRREPLDMRFDSTDERLERAERILATRDAEELTAIVRDYGEERFASRIARTIVARRREEPIASTEQLFAAIQAALPAQVRWRAARHAARVFQALRIAANDELDAIAEALPQALSVLAPGGRMVVIAFHSLEDRLVKNFFRDEQKAGRLRVLTRRPVQPTPDEIAANPRAGSAKLRAAERLSA
jgi:16S rRNA (cytosine1402-N4)-methyltransferase